MDKETPKKRVPKKKSHVVMLITTTSVVFKTKDGLSHVNKNDFKDAKIGDLIYI